MAKLSSRRFTHSRVEDVISFLFLSIMGIFMAMPMVYTICSAFKPMDELFLFPPTFFVKNPTLINFKNLSILMRESWVPFSRYIFNSVFITILGTVGHVVVASLAAFRIAKYEFPGRKILFEIVVMALMFSGAVTAIPNYLIMSEIGLVDTYWAIVVPAIGGSLGLFLMKQFMEQMIPSVLIEAAHIDGASEWTIFYRIVMPVVKPAWLTLIIFSFRDLWNATGGNFIFTEELKPLPYALQSIVLGGISRTGAASAVSLVMIIPPVLVFVLSQSNVIETMATSGMKD